MRFEVLSNAQIIGYTALEYGDPPMSIAHGKFIPTTSYDTIKSKIIAARGSLFPDSLGLSIRLLDGEKLDSLTLHIEDFSEEFDEIGITVFMADYIAYEKCFPEHVLAYKNQFN